MPELPEVETVVNRLRRSVCGSLVRGVELRWERMLEAPSVARFRRLLQNCRITAASRRGKYIVLHLSSTEGKYYLLLHLRMSGDLVVAEAGVPGNPYDRAVFELDGSRELRFNDIRKFGRIRLVKDLSQLENRLGVEPVSGAFTDLVLERALSRRSGAIKPVLLNQAVIAGIGNIYADESLWKAGIHPLRKASSLNRAEISRLRGAIQLVLKEAIRTGGTNIGDDVVPEGYYRVRVYGREGRHCFRCRGAIRRIVVGQRGTHFCPRCQPAGRGRG